MQPQTLQRRTDMLNAPLERQAVRFHAGAWERFQL